ncbi:hypothetical protein [Paenibacillus odorifer]|uniref:hypothetical protein n=1 Tax=Paenibacillus odorifer TaxID=189426 RepID=UPI0004F7B54E|nr:hypothetical protein [Paenibacillus odorifer]AIQ73028.1 hypothetical protein PODO_07055 [Paenibacillus odorifer]
MDFPKYEPEYPSIDVFITRFFNNLSKVLIFEQETKFAFPILSLEDSIEIFGQEYIIKNKQFAFHEDAFMTIYYIEDLIKSS